MNKPLVMISLAAALTAVPALADRDTLDAAIGGGLGGAAGAAIGNEIGGRNGAILGGAAGAAGGAAISTDRRDDYYGDRRRYDPRYDDRRYYRDRAPRGGFCPPGLAKQGRC